MQKHDKKFCNFKIHTQYSICEGALKIDDLASICKNNKIQSIGICDSYNLCGALEFSEKITKSGTQAIIGSQINFKVENFIGKLPLFATSLTGYRNLIKLSSKSYLESEQTLDPHCKIEDLQSLSEDIIVLTGGQFDFFGNLFK